MAQQALQRRRDRKTVTIPPARRNPSRNNPNNRTEAILYIQYNIYTIYLTRVLLRVSHTSYVCTTVSDNPIVRRS